MSAQLAEVNRQLELRRDMEDAFQRLLDGEANDDDKRLVAWGLGIANYQQEQKWQKSAK